LASAKQLLDKDNDEDCATVQNAADASNEESTNGATTNCTLHLNGNNIEGTWQSATTEKHLLTSWDADVATYIQHQPLHAVNKQYI
jgi:hypothetical protein